MSAEVTIHIPIRRGERIPRVARVLALAHHWRRLIRSGAVRDRADLARPVGVSRARISQVMRLLDLAPDLQEAVLEGGSPSSCTERVLRSVTRHATRACQHAAFADAITSS